MAITIKSPNFLQLTTSAAGSIHYAVTYVDISSIATLEPVTGVGIIPTATTTTLAATPGSGVTRKIDSIKLFNNGITNTLTLIIDNGGTDVIFAVVTLGNGEKYENGVVYNSDGYVKGEYTVNQSPILLDDIGQSGATDGQIPAWNNGASEWQPVTVATLNEAGVGALIAGAGDAVPNNTDFVATSNGTDLKKITWTNTKAFLKTYFDTLYQATGLAALKANNLSDLPSASTARTNLGLGTLATQSGTFDQTFTSAQAAKVGFISITQAVDLDAIETRVNDLDAAVVLKGTWDASAGTFPGGAVAQAGWSYIVSVAGTVGGVAFSVNDRIIAILDNASTTVYASNWHKADYTDQVLSVNSLTGAITLTQDTIGDGTTYKQYSQTEKTKLAGIATGATANDTDANLKNRANHTGTQLAATISDFNTAALTAAPAETASTLGATINGASAATPNDSDLVATVESSVVKKITWTNVKAFLKTYFDTLYQAVLVSGTNIKTINSNSIVGSGNLVVSASPAGSGGEVQYNLASVTTAAANVMIESDNLRLKDTTAPTPSNAGSVLYSMQKGGVNEVRIANRYGFDSALSNSFYDRSVFMVNPANGNSWTILGAHTIAATGTPTSTAPASTNLHTSLKRLEFLATSPATTNVVGWRESTGYNYWRGNAAGLGGFTFRCKWGPATGVSTSTTRAFCGMSLNVSAPTDVEPSTIVDMVGFGWDAADTNMQFMTNNGSGTATKIDLGSNFVVPTTDRQEVYDCRFYCKPNDTVMYYYIKNLRTGNEVEGSTSTDLPTNTSFMACRGYMSVGGTSSVIGLSLYNVLVENNN